MVPIVGPELHIEPQAFEINTKKLIDDYKTGYGNWRGIWKKIILPENWQVIETLVKSSEKDFTMHTEHWARILYDLAAAFHHWKGNRQLLVNLMTPLYYARVASFVNQTKEMSNQEAEKAVEHQAVVFEENKDYLIRRWDEDIEHH